MAVKPDLLQHFVHNALPEFYVCGISCEHGVSDSCTILFNDKEASLTCGRGIVVCENRR